jgi:hypothetical protein
MNATRDIGEAARDVGGGGMSGGARGWTQLLRGHQFAARVYLVAGSQQSLVQEFGKRLRGDGGRPAAGQNCPSAVGTAAKRSTRPGRLTLKVYQHGH